MQFWQKWVSMRNQLDFKCRQLLRWHRSGPYREPWEAKEKLFDTRQNAAALEASEIALLQRYDLKRVCRASTRLRYLETLTYLDALDQLFEETTFQWDTLRWLDVGVKNWAYVPALFAFAQTHSASFQLHGIELDGYRRYADLFTRADYAKTFMTDLPDTTYEVGDVLDHRRQYDVISSFLPFVFLDPCLQWGLPASAFRPDAYLQQLLALLAPQGMLIVMNQGEAEFQEQQVLFDQLNAFVPQLKIVKQFALPPSFVAYQHVRYIWLCQKI